MNIWNRLGDLAKGVGDWGVDVGMAATSPFKFAWDVVTSLGNDAEEYNGLVNTLKTAGNTWLDSAARPLGGAIAASVHVAENLVRQPLSAVLLYGQTGEWDKSWEARNQISVGQSLAGAAGSMTGAFLPDSVGPSFARDDFDIFDKTQRELAFKNSLYGRVVTGPVDFAADIFLDPTLALGKLGKIAKAGDSVEKMTKGINAARAGEKNKYYKMGEFFAANDTVAAGNHAWIKTGNNQGTNAYYFGQSKTVDEALAVMAAVTGDVSGVEGLLALKRPDLANPLYASLGLQSDDAMKAAMFTPEGRAARRLDINKRYQSLDAQIEETKAFSTPKNNMLAYLTKTQKEERLTLFERSQKELDLEREYLSVWAANDKMADDLYGISSSTPGAASITKGLGTFTEPTARFLAQARSVRYRPEGAITQEYYQPTVYHKLYSKFSWPLAERPAGMVNLNETSSIDEVKATVIRLVKLAKNEKTFSKDDGIKFIENYAKASGPEARQSVVHSLEATGFAALAKRYNVSSKDAEDLFEHFLAKRSSAVSAAKTGAFLVEGSTETLIKVSPFESQTANFFPMADFDVVKRLLWANKPSSKVVSMLRGSHSESISLLEQSNDVWKASVLLRLGYPVRNAVDSQLRIFATVGALATMKHVAGGIMNTAGNLKYNKVGNRIVDAFTGVGKRDPKAMSLELVKLNQKIGEEVAEAIKFLANAQRKGNANKQDILAEITKRKVQIETLEAARDIANKAIARVERINTGSGKKHMAEGSYALKSRYLTPDGEAHNIHDAFGGANSEYNRMLNSGEHSYLSLLNSHVTTQGSNVASKGIGVVRPTDVNYYTAWSDALNTTFRNSYVVNLLLKNNNVDEVAKIVGKNRAYSNRLGISRDEAKQHVSEIKSFFDNYIPRGFGIEKKLIDQSRNGIITPEFLRSSLGKMDSLPTIHGNLLNEAINMNSRNIIDNTMTTLFKFLGSMPEDNWARHPLFVDLYRKSVQKRFNAAEFQNGKKFTKDEFAELQYNLERAARDDAIRGVKKTLYNVERRSNAAHLLRFVSPFFSAQENALKTWMKIGTENVGILSRAGTIWTAPNRMGIATDQDGNLVPMENAINANDTMWFELPKGVAKFLHVDTLNQIGISKRSVDVIFQGNPIGVGVGPYVGLPMGYLAKKKPEIGEVLSFAFPYGPDASVKQLMPTWGRRLMERAQGTSDSDYAKAYQLIWLTEQHKARDNGTPYLTEKQIQRKTNDYYSMRTMASLILPFAPQFKSPYRYYMDQWRVYQDKYGIEADSKFLEAYPDFFDFATTLSKNTTGMEASMSAVNNAKKYSSLISEVAKDSPSLIGLITNNTGGMEYSPTASWWQSETNVSPGDPMKFRETGTPQENIAKNEARQGWAEYRKVMSTIDTHLAKRGMTSLEQRGAEDLKAMKEKMVASIANKYDPTTGLSTGETSAWYNEYRDVDGTKAARTIAGLRKILNNATFMKDNGNSSTWKSVAYYLEVRDRIAGQLSMRESSSIDSEGNADLRATLDYYVNRLKRDDIGFADIYTRYLSRDTIYDKNLSMGA